MKINLILLAVSMFIWGIGEGMFLFLQPLYLQELGANPVEIGAILSGFSAAMAIAHIPAGYMADKIGRRPLIWLSWGLGIFAASFMALANTLNTFVIGLFLYGMTFFVMSPLYSYATAARGKLSVGQAIMIVSVSFNLGMVIGPWLGGMLGEQYGLRIIFYYAAGIFVIAALVIAFIKPQPVEARLPSHTRLSVLKDRRLLTYLGVLFFTVLALHLPQPLSQNYLRNEIGLSIEVIGRLASFMGIGVFLLSLLVGRLEPRRGIVIGQLAMGVFAFLLWQGNSLFWFGMAYFLLGGFKIARSLMVAQTTHLVHPSNIGFTYGVTETVGSIAVILAAFLAGVFYQFSPPSMYIVSLVLITISVIAIWFFSPAAQGSHLAQPDILSATTEEEIC